MKSTTIAHSTGAVAAPNGAFDSGSMVLATDAGPIEYAERGAGLPLLSIHGAGGGFDQGLANAADLIGDGFRVIAPSRFGYLRTPVPRDVSAVAQADAHAALLMELRLPKAVVLGVSTGARSAVELALRHPEMVAALILVAPALYSPSNAVVPEPPRRSALARTIVDSGLDFAWRAALRFMPSRLVRFVGVPPALLAILSGEARARVMRSVRNIQPLSQRFIGLQLDELADLPQVPLQRIAAPTLILSAQDDPLDTLPAAEFTARRIRGARLVTYETGGHLLAGREAQARSAVRGFLAKARLIPFLRVICNDRLAVRQPRIGRLAQVSSSEE
jgi:pimeloyl-ACP methyl ester carboxylesterase